MLFDISGSFDSVHLRHFDIQKQQIYGFFFQMVDDLLSVFGFSGKSKLWFFLGYDLFYALTNKIFIICNQ